MKISVAIAALNEGAQLAATVADLLANIRPPDEIVVVDDNSFIVQSVPREWPVRLVRTDTPVGSGPAKHMAAGLCTGDLVIVMDAHMRVPVDFVGIIADEHRRSPWAVLCPRSHGMESLSTHDGMGGHFTTESGFWKVSWAQHRPAEFHSYAVPAVIGGCYCIPRCVLSRIGGYAPGFAGYGLEEEYLSLRAWIAGGECRVVPRTGTRHYFMRPLDRRTAVRVDRPWAMHYNRHVAAMVCFDDGVYESVYKPRLDAAGRHAALDALLAEKSSEIAAVRADFKKNRRLSDALLPRWCGVTHP